MLSSYRVLLQPSHIRRDEDDVDSVANILENMWINPFNSNPSGNVSLSKTINNVLFGHMELIQTTRNLNMQEGLKHPLGPLLWSPLWSPVFGPLPCSFVNSGWTMKIQTQLFWPESWKILTLFHHHPFASLMALLSFRRCMVNTAPLLNCH